MCRIVVILLLAGVSAADAAPAIPPSELPGRERYRFTPSPLDRFMQPSQPSEPLLWWDCDGRESGRPIRRTKRSRNC